MTGDRGHAQGPLAGQDHSTPQHLVERMEAKGDNWAIWQGKPLELTYALTFRPRSRRVRRHPVVVAARMAARLALNAARAAAFHAAAIATKTALKYGLIAAPRQVLPNAIRWGTQVAGRTGVNQATRTIWRAARRGARRAGATPGRSIGSAGLRSRQAVTRTAEVARQQWGRAGTAWRSSTGRLFRGRQTHRMDILQPAPGATKMGHLKRAIRVTGFVIKWGAHLATLAAGVWMLHGMVIIKIQANKERRLLDNHLVKRGGKEETEEEKEYPDDAHLMDIYSFPGYQVEVEVETILDGSSKPVILDAAIKDVVDPVVLGNAGVLVYKIPAARVKLLVDDWVDVEDLLVDDNTYHNDTDPAEMATPAPSQKVWLASDVHNWPTGPGSRGPHRAIGCQHVREAEDEAHQATGAVVPVRGQAHIGGKLGNHPLHGHVGAVPLYPLVNNVSPGDGLGRPR
jgi:hypothetical protein